MNNLKTGILLTLLTVLLVWAGAALGGQQGAILAFEFRHLRGDVSADGLGVLPLETTNG